MYRGQEEWVGCCTREEGVLGFGPIGCNIQAGTLPGIRQRLLKRPCHRVVIFFHSFPPDDTAQCPRGRAQSGLVLYPTSCRVSGPSCSCLHSSVWLQAKVSFYYHYCLMKVLPLGAQSLGV